jgi:hypothetical protein
VEVIITPTPNLFFLNVCVRFLSSFSILSPFLSFEGMAARLMIEGQSVVSGVTLASAGGSGTPSSIAFSNKPSPSTTRNAPASSGKLLSMSPRSQVFFFGLIAVVDVVVVEYIREEKDRNKKKKKHTHTHTHRGRVV